MKSLYVGLCALALGGCNASGVSIADVDAPQIQSKCVAPVACPNLDPVSHLPYGGEIAPCGVIVRVGIGQYAPCYYGLGPATGVCEPDPATAAYYDPAPPAHYLVASSCDECAKAASNCN